MYIVGSLIILMQMNCSDPPTGPNGLSNINTLVFSPPPQINVSQLIDSLATFKKYTGNFEICSTDTLIESEIAYGNDAIHLGGGFDSRQQEIKYSAVRVLDVRRPAGGSYSVSSWRLIDTDDAYQSICDQIFSQEYLIDQNTRIDSLYLRLFRVAAPQFDSVSFHFVRVVKLVLDQAYLQSGEFTPNAKCLLEDSAVASFENNYGNSFVQRLKPCAIFIHVFSVRCQTGLGARYLDYKIAFELLCQYLWGINPSIQNIPLAIELRKIGIRSLTISTLDSLNSCEIVNNENEFHEKLSQFSSYYDEQIKNDTLGKVHAEEFSLQPYDHLLGPSGTSSSAYFPSFP